MSRQNVVRVQIEKDTERNSVYTDLMIKRAFYSSSLDHSFLKKKGNKGLLIFIILLIFVIGLFYFCSIPFS